MHMYGNTPVARWWKSDNELCDVISGPLCGSHNSKTSTSNAHWRYYCSVSIYAEDIENTFRMSYTLNSINILEVVENRVDLSWCRPFRSCVNTGRYSRSRPTGAFQKAHSTSVEVVASVQGLSSFKKTTKSLKQNKHVHLVVALLLQDEGDHGWWKGWVCYWCRKVTKKYQTLVVTSIPWDHHSSLLRDGYLCHWLREMMYCYLNFMRTVKFLRL